MAKVVPLHVHVRVSFPLGKWAVLLAYVCRVPVSWMMRVSIVKAEVVSPE